MMEEVGPAISGLVLVAVALLAAFMRKALKDIQTSNNGNVCRAPEQMPEASASGQYTAVLSLLDEQLERHTKPISARLDKVDDRLGKVCERVSGVEARLDERKP